MTKVVTVNDQGIIIKVPEKYPRQQKKRQMDYMKQPKHSKELKKIMNAYLDRVKYYYNIEQLNKLAPPKK